ncbi:Caspase domain-containing protein [Duganella sp. CF402]|uniref:caspase family protein n=1 Tax=unclassified Duganella TaxID=2636909 RepID=UPI0008D4D88F|nr:MULTISPECIES: caspase family protein [unclassified Duganella]RZT05745.1 caspase domain-containing protein [Duganella sp. BK701]SEM92792.1 Caspase domain-containing protein [Duganella sp. CF402]
MFLSSEKYQQYDETPYCHADAAKLCETLLENCDYLIENTLSLALEPGDGKGAAEIIEKVTDLFERSEDGDSILFFFAGHGAAIDNETYLILPDTSRSNVPGTSLKLSDIEYLLSKNKRLNIRIFDCCHSGEGSRDAVPRTEADSFMRAILSGGTDCSMTFASCAVHEKSYSDESIGHGIFTSSLIAAIKDQKADSHVYAETVKIAVCDAVQQWCQSRGKSQTPTLRVQVTGNMPFAKRKALQVQGSIPVTTTLPLSKRLENARKIEVVDERFYPDLKASLSLLETKLNNLFAAEDLYGILLKKTPTKKVEDIPAFLKERILVRMKSHRTMHTMEAVRVERPQLKSAFSSIFESKPVFDTNYYINQKDEMPDCFLTFESVTDGYIPSTTFFVYICPLQASVAILVGYYFDRAFYDAESDYHIQKLSHKIYSVGDFREKKYLDDLSSLVQTFQFDLGIQINERLTYLEKELDTVEKGK